MGANTVSNNINKDTSGELRYLGPNVNSQLATPMKNPWDKNNYSYCIFGHI